MTDEDLATMYNLGWIKQVEKIMTDDTKNYMYGDLSLLTDEAEKIATKEWAAKLQIDEPKHPWKMTPFERQKLVSHIMSTSINDDPDVIIETARKFEKYINEG